MRSCCDWCDPAAIIENSSCDAISRHCFFDAPCECLTLVDCKIIAYHHNFSVGLENFTNLLFSRQTFALYIFLHNLRFSNTHENMFTIKILIHTTLPFYVYTKIKMMKFHQCINKKSVNWILYAFLVFLYYFTFNLSNRVYS